MRMRTIKTIITLLILSVFVFGCKSKKVLKQEAKVTEKIEFKSKNIKDSSSSESVVKAAIGKKSISDIIQAKNTDIEIKGKVNPGNPLIYYNIVNGDTLDNISISGSAEVIYRSNRNDLKRDSKSESDSLNTSDKQSKSLSSNLIEGVSNTAKAIQAKTTEVVKKDFQFGAYFTFLIWGVVAIILIIIIMWVKKSTFWKDIISKIKNN
jgi:hypothetical protein